MKSIKVNLFLFYLVFTCYYLLISAIGRIAFCLKGNIEIIPSNIFNFQIIRIDAATSAYLFLPILLVLFFIKNEIVVSKIVKVYILFCSFLSLLIDYISATLYIKWGEILNARAFGYISYKDGLRTIINEINFSDIFSVLVLTIMFVLISNSSILKIQGYLPKFKYLWFTLCLAILVLVARGGFQKIPINSGVLFENQPLEQNLCRINKSYYLFQSLLKSNNVNNDDPTIEKSTYKTIACKNSTEYFKIDKPNFVFIILEGVSIDFFESKTNSAYSAHAPFLNKISTAGVSFSNIYSSGFRTDQGLLSVFSGVPALPEINIMKELRAIDFEPSLFKSLKKLDYTNSFFYGGDLSFSEMKRYLINQEIDQLVGGNSIQSKSAKLDWGFAEDLVFDAMLTHLDTVNTPFFTSCLTLSTHSPFDIVERFGVNLESEKSRYSYSVNKLDEYIEEFINKASQKPWYNNTLFVFVSDHGSMHLKNCSAEDHKRWQVPLFFYGEVLRDEYKSMKVSTFGNHYDLPETIEKMLGISIDTRYRFSRDLFCQNEDDSGYWTSGHAAGYLTNRGSTTVQQNEVKYFNTLPNDNDSIKAVSQFNALRTAIVQDIMK